LSNFFIDENIVRPYCQEAATRLEAAALMMNTSATPRPAPEKTVAPRQRRASLPEVHQSILVPKHLSFWRKMLAFSGPATRGRRLMDPGNWATDSRGGSRFGYTLLSVILISNLMAILLQSTLREARHCHGRDLAQACRDHYSRLWPCALLLCEVPSARAIWRK